MASSLSLCVIARDAADTLSDTLKSVKGLASELIVIIDPRTTDTTAQIADSFKATVFYRDFDNFASQKNYALSQAKSKWILALDADEYLSSKAQQEIAAILTQSTHVAYSFPRLNYIFGRPIYHTNWSPESDRHVRLFSPPAAHWARSVHEELVITGEVGRLTGPILHTNYRTVEQYLTKMNQYTSLENRQVNLLYPFWKFFRHYFLYLGFLDSWHGLFLSYLQAIYGLEVYIKAWQKKNSS